MKKLLIHLHLYYPEYCTELSQCIESLMPEYNFDLFVTLPKQNSYLSQKILASFPNANIQVVENIGFDIYPFVKVIKSVNLDDYSYVIKLHTKRDINFNMFSFFKNKWFGGGNWREGLLSFIKSKLTNPSTLNIAVSIITPILFGMLLMLACFWASMLYTFISLSIIILLTLFGINEINSSSFKDVAIINLPPFLTLSIML